MVEVIIPTYNGETHIAKLMESLVCQDEQSFSIIIADNGSKDNTVETVKNFENLLDLEIIDASDKPGKAHALNKAIQATDDGMLLFIDQDDTVNDSYVSAMSRALGDAPLVAATMDAVTLNTQFDTPPRFAPSNQKIGEFTIKVAAGGTLGIQRGALYDIGLFDENFNVSTNDVEFCCRAHYAGYDLQLVEEATVYYRFRSSLIENFRQGVYYGKGNFAVAQRYPEVRAPQVSFGALVIEAGTSLASFLQHKKTRARDIHIVGKAIGQAQELVRARF